MPKPTRDRVFLSYAHEDLDTVLRIYSGLKERQLNVWFDKEHLKPGEWMPQIEKAILRSRYFIICISNSALRKTGDDEPGFIDKELNAAYKIADRQPVTEFTIVPVRLEDCDRGDFRLASFQQYDLFENFENNLDKLAIDLGGISLADAAAQDERTSEEKIIEAIWSSASAAFYANNFEKGLALINSILEIKPDDALAWANKGVALDKLVRHEEALAALDKALEIDPNDANAWIRKGAVLLARLGRPEEALAALNKALEIDPSDVDAWSGKGNALAALGRHEEALAALDKALKLKPDLEHALQLKKLLSEKNLTKPKKPFRLFKKLFTKS